jgi:hypothetical protein
MCVYVCVCMYVYLPENNLKLGRVDITTVGHSTAIAKQERARPRPIRARTLSRHLAQARTRIILQKTATVVVPSMVHPWHVLVVHFLFVGIIYCDCGLVDVHVRGAVFAFVALLYFCVCVCVYKCVGV